MTTTLTPLQKLHEILDETVTHIHDFTTSSKAFIRNRKLNAKTLLEVTLNMQGNSLNSELLEAFPDINDRMTASAYEQAKAKLTPKAFEYIFNQFNKHVPALKKLNGKYRFFAIDGTKFTTPYDPKSSRIAPIAAGVVCMTHANILYDLENKRYTDCIISSVMDANERKAALQIIDRIDKTDPFIVVMDRGYDGFNFVEHLNRVTNCHYVIRTRIAGGIKEIKALPDKECDVDFDLLMTTSYRRYKSLKESVPNAHFINCPATSHKESLSPKTCVQEWDFGDMVHTKFRVVKFKIRDDHGKDAWEVLITNLNRFEFPVAKMKELYHARWDIETSFRSLKYALGGIHFHSKKDAFIDMEIWSHLIMFNVVSSHVAQVHLPSGSHKYAYMIDFKMACHIVRKYFRRAFKGSYGLYMQS